MCEEIGFQLKSILPKTNNITQKVSERHQWNFAACIVTAGGICVPKMNILGAKL